MTNTRKLWKVIYNGTVYRPESKVKAYGIYVENALRTRLARNGSRFASVWVDSRDGNGWVLYERVDLDELAHRD